MVGRKPHLTKCCNVIGCHLREGIEPAPTVELCGYSPWIYVGKVSLCGRAGVGGYRKFDVLKLIGFGLQRFCKEFPQFSKLR